MLKTGRSWAGHVPALPSPILEALEPRVLLSVNLTKDINSIGLSQSGLPSNLFDANGTVFFAADDVVHGTELWESDGTVAGTNLVRDIRPDRASSSPMIVATVAWLISST